MFFLAFFSMMEQYLPQENSQLSLLILRKKRDFEAITRE